MSNYFSPGSIGSAPMPNSPEHDVEVDNAGWGNWERLTCHTCGKTLVRQPYMRAIKWQELKEEFLSEHGGG